VKSVSFKIEITCLECGHLCVCVCVCVRVRVRARGRGRARARACVYDNVL
jgi:hypothetical protein